MSEAIWTSSTPAVHQLEALTRVSRQLGTGMSLSAVLDVAFQEAMIGTMANGGRISLYHDADEAFMPRHAYGASLPAKISREIEKTVQESQKLQVFADLPRETGIGSVLAAPIIFEGVVAGLMMLNHPDKHHFGHLAKTFVEALTNHISMAIVNAQLLQDTLQRERFYAALGRVTLALNATVNLPDVLDLICQESLGLFNVDGAYIWQIQEESLVAIAARGHAADEIVGCQVDLQDTSFFAAAVVLSGRGRYRNRISRQRQYHHHFSWQKPIKALMAIPLIHEGETIGVLELVDTVHSDRFSQQEIDQSTVFGIQAATAIQNAQLVTEMRQLNEQLDERVIERTKALGQERDRVNYLLRVTSELTSSLDQDRVLIKALELINEVVQATHGSILLVDTITGKLIYPSAFETHKLPPLPRVDIGPNPNEGPAGWLIKNREAIVIADTASDSRWQSTPDGHDLRSVLAVPLISNDEPIGILTLFHEEPAAFSKEQLELVVAAANQVASAISNAQLYLLIRDQAERLGRLLRDKNIEAAKNKSILESIADGVLVADDKGKIILANLSSSQILEKAESELIGESIYKLLEQYITSGSSWKDTIDSWPDADDQEDWRHYVAERLEIADRSVSMHLSPVIVNEQFFGTVSILRDVTQEVEVDRMKSEFISTVSHELRTPMTSIKGYAELILMGAAGTLTEAQARYLEVIRNNADRMSSLINDLLDISRIESGKTELDVKPVDISQLIEQVVKAHILGLVRHEDKQISFTFDVEPSLPLLYADRDRLTQILTNILDNAFNYTPAGGKISLKAKYKDRFVYISISDSGIGMGPDKKDKIFERYYRAEDEAVQEVPGTGLGLSIVKSLVEMHDGTIEVDSTPGKGSTFTVGLPAVRSNETSTI